MNSNRLSTKQFADLCKVEKRTLHYYDEIGLLKPVEVKDNGYRVYSSGQFDTMSMIKALQSVGMSLDEIRKLMNEHDLSHCKAVLNHQISLIREKQKELKNAEKILCHTTMQLDSYLETGCDRFFTEEAPAVYLVMQKIEENLPVFINYITSGYYLGVIMNEEQPTIPQYIFKQAVTEKCSDAVKPAGTYACIYQSIPDGKISDRILSFFSYLTAADINTDGPLYMDSIANDFIAFPRQENIFKFSIRIKNS